jgi:Xaa-Pro aminopeptidase
MLQTFETTSDPALGPPRVKSVRTLMSEAGIHVLLVPRSDEFQGEYVPPSAERLKWLTGFSGSAGLAIVGMKTAAVATDGRYTVQAKAQAHSGTFEVIDSTQKPWIEWLAAKLPNGGTLGYDPRLHTAQAITALKPEAEKHGFALKALSANLIDKAWGRTRPAPPIGAISVQPTALAGVAAETKIIDIQRLLKVDQQHAVVLTLSDSISWLFNIRGSDIAHNPVVLAFAIVPVKGKPELFVDPAKLTVESKKHLTAVAKLTPIEDLGARLRELKAEKDRKVRVDPATASAWIVNTLGSNADYATDPCILPKAKKNKAELDGARAAHVRDGVAMVRFLSWLDGESQSNSLDEIRVVERLEAFRSATGQLKDLSFGTIAGSGPNGALPHYRVSKDSNRLLQQGEMIVIDSGGQYQDGTTDITRTVAIGMPSQEMRLRFTQVLKGHIAIATARFPVGTRGVQLDTLARYHLWQAGLDFDHGTGHGVGSFLSVHEGPQSISKRGMAVLEPGMIISNEPGFYKQDAFGIRIENLEVVTEPSAIKGGDRQMLGFECLTLAPIDHRCIEPDQLTQAEVAWLNTYHARVLATLGGEVSVEERKWLVAATKPVSRVPIVQSLQKPRE